FRSAWALSILANMHAGVVGRQAPLLTATGASRSAFAQSMDHLIEIGLMERNPGYGHPLRPEFRLTELGKTTGKITHQIYHVADDEDKFLLRRSWTLPILVSIHAPSYFNDIKKNLPSITDRALSQSLTSMENRNWVSRTVSQAARPPRPIYRAINAGGTISQIMRPEIHFSPP
ncbi:MAG: winged helix-turn-helix transcriptional regulator, partial [Pseudomonadota bacterium]